MDQTKDHTPSEPLLDCPFCGRKAEYRFNSTYKNYTMAGCTSCGATAFWTKWNTRVASAKQSG